MDIVGMQKGQARVRDTLKRSYTLSKKLNITQNQILDRPNSQNNIKTQFFIKKTKFHIEKNIFRNKK